MNPHGLIEIFVVNSGPSLVQEINSIKELRIHIPCISCEPSLNWSLVLDKLIMEFTEMTQLGSFSTVLTRLAELWFEAESV